MNVQKYKVTSNIEMWNMLFLEGDIIYVTDAIYTQDVFEYIRKVFDVNRKFLGRISDNYYESTIRHSLTDKLWK